MRTIPVVVLFVTALTLAACERKDARPAKEAVAEAKAAAGDAKDVAREAAASVRESAQQATEEAEAAATKASAKADQAAASAARAVQEGVATAAQGVRELGEGGVVTGRVSAVSGSRLALRPEKSGPAELRLDDRTRYLLRGSTLQNGGLHAGSRVRATYVVEARVPIATEVEVLAK